MWDYRWSPARNGSWGEELAVLRVVAVCEAAIVSVAGRRERGWSPSPAHTGYGYLSAPPPPIETDESDTNPPVEVHESGGTRLSSFLFSSLLSSLLSSHRFFLAVILWTTATPVPLVLPSRPSKSEHLPKLVAYPSRGLLWIHVFSAIL